MGEQLSVVREFTGRPAGVQCLPWIFELSPLDPFMHAYSGRSHACVRPCGAHVRALTPWEARRRTAAVGACSRPSVPLLRLTAARRTTVRLHTDTGEESRTRLRDMMSRTYVVHEATGVQRGAQRRGSFSVSVCSIHACMSLRVRPCGTQACAGLNASGSASPHRRGWCVRPCGLRYVVLATSADGMPNHCPFNSELYMQRKGRTKSLEV